VSRSFNGSNEFVELSIGTSGGLGAWTVAAIIKRTIDGVYGTVFDTHAGAAEFGLWGLDSANKVWVRDSGDQTAPTITLVAADGWTLIAWTKAAGVATPRFHRYLYDTQTWTHENAPGTVSGAGAGPTAAYVGKIGNRDYVGMKLALLGVWGSVLTDNQLEGMTADLNDWSLLTPNGLWRANDNPMNDLTGNGANQIVLGGTLISVADEPPSFTNRIDGGRVAWNVG
jgi:hypothetical protein